MNATVYNVLLILLPVLFFAVVGVFIYRFVRRSHSLRKAPLEAPTKQASFGVV
jgi:cytochrome c-type biogenesis protein CcmH/NrfF